MEWLLDRNKACMREIWLFEAARALETTTNMAKAQRGLDGFPKKKFVLEVC